MDNQNQVIPPEFEMVKYILEILRTQGLSFLLLGVAVWYLQSQNMELRRDVLNCQSTQIEYLTTKTETLTKTLESNTTALNRIVAVIERKK